MKCDIITLFPGMVAPVLDESILKRARQRGLVDIRVSQLRDFTTDKHRTADDVPYGGGPGMLLKPEPIFAAVDKARQDRGEIRLIIPSPQGVLFNQNMAADFSREKKSLVFICGHYEGIDARVMEGLPVEEVSIGDFILTGGELAALMMIDAAARLIPGVLGEPASLEEESFSSPLLEYPHYTRPAEFRGMKVPDTLISGNHRAIRAWKKRQALLNTLRKRPELLSDASLSEEQKEWMKQHAESDYTSVVN
ncbi:MAG: tRNA (guanosine(37)-N1)-methyltransferase TrmD [Candidatus Manganitrophaceae bacterium]